MAVLYEIFTISCMHHSESTAQEISHLEWIGSQWVITALQTSVSLSNSSTMCHYHLKDKVMTFIVTLFACENQKCFNGED